MFFPRRSQARALLCLLLCVNLAIAGAVQPLRRDDPVPAPSLSSNPPPSSTGGGEAAATSTDPPASSSKGPPPSSTTVTNAPSAPAHTTEPGSSLNSTLFGNKIPPGELPIPPRITPGWAVAGVLLLVAGACHALVGIKSRWFHAFFSAAALGALGTTVLIIYVMTPPISDPVQGAYVVAAICTGLVLGGLSVIFKETTECLGCLLGGFCFSMWLLTLTEGGLLPHTGPKVAFIVALSLAAFAVYFSHWTRSYGLIVCISFSGATSTVLGIDCFSRAGLKEFWAYVWDLNGDLFPLGTETYPLTRGMRVELAATIIITVTGIVSQLKLWRVVRERRAMRAAERAEGDRNLREEEESVGRRIEEANDRERDEWERAYGDQTRPRSSARPSGDSGVGDMESEKKKRSSEGIAVTELRGGDGGVGSGGDSSEEHIEMMGMPAREDVSITPPPPPKPTAAETVISHNPADGSIMVRVAHDDVTAGMPDGDGEGSMGGSRSSRQAKPDPRRSILGATTPVPNLVPLPFRVATPPWPEEKEEMEKEQEEERSSVATFSPEDEVVPAAGGNRRDSMAKRLSASSSKLFRSFSQRSSMGGEHGESREELTASRLSRRDDNDSVAANLDDLSVGDSDSDIDTVRDEGAGTPRLNIEINADLSKEGEALGAGTTRARGSSPTSPAAESAAARESTTAETAPTGIFDSLSRGVGDATGTTTPEPFTGLMKKDTADVQAATREASSGENGSSKELDGGKSRQARSSVSAESRAASLTRDNLPARLSRVAMSYRTNEWAKHLSFAETPEPENLKLNEYRPEPPSSPSYETRDGDDPVPLDVDELQKTADSASPPPAAPRSASAMSSHHAQPYGSIPPSSAAGSRASLQPTAGPESHRSASAAGVRRVTPLHPEPIEEERDHELHTAPTSAGASDNVDSPPNGPSPSPPESSTPLPDRPSSRIHIPGVVSYSSPQTLIGKREMFLRSKSQASFYQPGAAEPPAMSTIISRSSSETGSMYNAPPPAPVTPGPQRGPSASHLSLDVPDADDIPLSHRREMMRQSSYGNGGNTPNNGFATPPPNNRSSTTLGPMRSASSMSGALATADSVPFNSHQPQRRSNVASEAARKAQLASFRSSVAADLRAGSPVAVVAPGGTMAAAAATTTSLGGLGGGGTPVSLPGAGRGRASSQGSYGLEAEVRRTVDAQRSFLLGQKEAEAQKREMERLEKERGDREFEERMRRGELMEAHREAMRRLQGGVRE